MRGAIEETARRRKIQNAYNVANGITPKTIVKGVRDIIEIGADESKSSRGKSKPENSAKLTAAAREKLIEDLTSEMKSAARRLEFEQAAYLRDRIKKLREGKIDTVSPKKRKTKK